MDSKAKNSQTKRNRRRSARNITVNGDTDDSKDRNNKRSRDSKDNDDGLQDIDLYKDLLDLVPAEHLNCSPTEHPASPGTRVNLHGVILHETVTGLIVLNVRWRNKIYSGALLDVDKNKWACDRVKDHENVQAPPPIKKIKIPTSNNSLIDDDYDPKKREVTSPTTPSKNSKTSRGNNKKRSTQDTPYTPAKEENTPTKKTKKVVQSSEFECPEPDCDRKYKNKNGLANHLKNIHEKTMKPDTEEQSEKEKSEDSDSGEDQFVIDEKDDDTTEETKDDHLPPIQNTPSSPTNNDKSLTENEKQIERIKLKIEQSQKTLQSIKQETPTSETKTIITEQETSKNEIGKQQTNNQTDTNTVKIESRYEEKKSSNLIERDFSVKSEENIVVPTIHVENVSEPMKEEESVNTTEVKQEDDSIPQGSRRTIIHEDNVASLNELFAPAQTYQQYSPTLSQLNPQKINESLTDALAKQQKEAKANALPKEGLVKAALMAKPSLEVKPMGVDRMNYEQIRIMKTYELLSGKSETIDCSDDERSISPDNLLKDCHKLYPQDDKEVEVAKPNLMSMAVASGNLYMNPVIPSVLSQKHKTFENTLIVKELSSKLSSTAVNINSLQPNIPIRGHPEFAHQTLHIDPKKVPPQFLNFMKPPGSYLQTIDGKSALITSNDPMSTLDSNKQSLLQQRLRATKTESNTTVLSSSSSSSTSANSAFLPQHINQGSAIPSRTTDSMGLDPNRLPKKNLFISNEHMPEKTKESRVGTMMTWYPEAISESQQPPQQQQQTHQHQQGKLPKEYFTTQTVSTSFRMPSTTPSTNNIHIFNSTSSTADKNSKFKRTSQPIPIAPAPSTVMSSIPNSIMTMSRPDLVSSEHQPADSDYEQPQMNRYTLTSDNRLIPSPAENRGRPRKIRVEKTHQVPVGTAQEIARSRGPAESPVMRKHPASPVARASVIQGSSLGPTTVGEATSLSKTNERIDEHPLYQQARNFENETDERSRYPMLGKMPPEMRSNPEKYKEFTNISSPSMFRPGSRPSRAGGVLSPPSTASSGAPPHESLPPSISPDVMLSQQQQQQAHYHHQLAMDRMKSEQQQQQRFLEMHHANKPELTLRTSEPPRPPGDLSKTTFSTREKMILPPSAMVPREIQKDHRAPEYSNPMSRFPGPLRPDFHPAARPDAQRSPYDPSRPSLEEKDATRRFPSGQPSPVTATTSHMSQPPQSAHLSNNLVLGRADGAIIGPLPNEFHYNERKR